MKKSIILLLLLVCGFYGFCQKIVGDCTVTFSVNAVSGIADINGIKNTHKKLYISGGKSLTELTSNGFEQKTIYNISSDNVYILYNMNNDKYMRVLSKNEWMEQYDNYKNLTLEPSDETKNILGYNCKKATEILGDGSKVNIYYTTELKTTVGENPYEQGVVNGLVLQYETVFQNKYRIVYTASSIDFNPVPSEKFLIPKTGYRILNGNGHP